MTTPTISPTLRAAELLSVLGHHPLSNHYEVTASTEYVEAEFTVHCPDDRSELFDLLLSEDEALEVAVRLLVALQGVWRERGARAPILR